MKYDLNRLKEAMDERIPMIQPDEGLLDRAMAQGKRARYPARALTAARSGSAAAGAGMSMPFMRFCSALARPLGVMAPPRGQKGSLP